MLSVWGCRVLPEIDRTEEESTRTSRPLPSTPYPSRSPVLHPISLALDLKVASHDRK